MKKNNNETKLVCPQCGAEFAIPEHETVAVGTTIGKDSNLGVLYPKVVGQYKETSNKTKSKKEMKASEKIAALKAAGVNTSNLFAMSDGSANGTVVILKEGVITPVSDDDPMFASIFNGDTIPNRSLFRRWIMAQTFHMMSSPVGFNKTLQNKGYQYQWKMLLEELRVQAILFREDRENFQMRNRWFNAKVVADICQEYHDKLKDHISDLTVKYCKGLEYIHLRRRDVFVSDLYSKVYAPLRQITVAVLTSTSPSELHANTVKFYKEIQKCWLNSDIRMEKAFIDAYKGAGAYFTMRNLILFHDCKMRDKRGRFLSTKTSIARLDELAENCEGWWLFGAMKKLLKDNNIDIFKKMAEWRN